MAKLRIEGIGFNPEVVARHPEDEFVARESSKYFPKDSPAKREQKLRMVHQLCTEAANIGGVLPPAPPVKPKRTRGRRKKLQ